MRMFLDETTHPGSDEPNLRATNCYIELEFPIDDSSCAVIYLIPRTESSVFVATCWGTTFDELLSNPSSQTVDMITETWPTLATLLYNGLSDKYRDGALIKLEDPDYGENKWFVASVAGNISFENADTLFADRTMETINVVVTKSLELMVELQEKKPNMARAFGKGVLTGLGTVALGAVALALGVDPDDLLS